MKLKRSPLLSLLLIYLISISISVKAQSIFPTIDAKQSKIYDQKVNGISNPQQKITVLLALAEYHLKKPQEKKADLDSCKKFLARAKLIGRTINGKKAEFKVQILQALLADELRDPNAAKIQLTQIITKSNNLGFFDIKGRALYELGMLHNQKEKFVYFDQAIAAFRTAGENNIMATLMLVLADYQMASGKFDKPYGLLLEAIKYQQTARSYVLLAGIATYYRNQTEALNYGLLAVEAAKKEKNQMREAEAYAGLAEIYRQLYQDQNALETFNAARLIMSKFQMMTGYYDMCRGLAYTYLGMGKTKEAIQNYLQNMGKYPPVHNIDKFRYNVILTNLYVRSDDYKNANYHHETAKSLVPKNENPNGIYTLTRTSAEFYYRFKDYDKAKALYAYGNKIFGEKVEHLLRIASIDSINGNFQSAFKYAQRAKKLNDSLLSESRSKLVAGLQIKFDLKQKETDLQIKDQHIEFLNQNTLLLNQKAEIADQELKLNANKFSQAKLKDEKKSIAIKLKDQNIQILNRQASLQSLQLKQQVFVRNITFAFIVLFLFIIVLLIRQYWLKQKNHRVVAEKNNLLQQLLLDKDWLLKEMHHRVKNNLHTVMSLLESQSAYLEDDALIAVQNSQHRIFAMSLIHQKLYQSEDIKTINMAHYIPELVNYLRDSINKAKQIAITMNVHPIELDVAEAVPIGLIINEVMTNAIKYAFDNRTKGTINIDFTGLTEPHYNLVMKDDGVGLPPHFSIDKVKSLGLKLIKGLSQQLGATLTIDSNQGTTVSVKMCHSPFLLQHINK